MLLLSTNGISLCNNSYIIVGLSYSYQNFFKREHENREDEDEYSVRQLYNGEGEGGCMIDVGAGIGP